jgi:hypothetical protein
MKMGSEINPFAGVTLALVCPGQPFSPPCSPGLALAQLTASCVTLGKLLVFSGPQRLWVSDKIL